MHDFQTIGLITDRPVRIAAAIVAMFVAFFYVPLAVLWRYVWRERLLDQWTVYRLRVARRVRRADYIRWWRAH